MSLSEARVPAWGPNLLDTAGRGSVRRPLPLRRAEAEECARAVDENAATSLILSCAFWVCSSSCKEKPNSMVLRALRRPRRFIGLGQLGARRI